MNMRLCFGCQTGLFTLSCTNHVVPLHYEKGSEVTLLCKSNVQCEVFFPKHFRLQSTLIHLLLYFNHFDPIVGLLLL